MLHLISKLFSFDALNAWIEQLDQHQLIDFFLPSELEIVFVLTIIALYPIGYYISKYQNQKNINLSDIMAALRNNEIDVVFVPKKSLDDMTIVGVECLPRWHHKKYGLLSAEEFMSVAESNDKIMKSMTSYIVARAAEAYAELKSHGFDIEMAVNVTKADLIDTSIVTTITNSLSRHKMPAEKLVLEVTETAIMHNLEVSIKLLINLDSSGSKISLDDFGTGHSSFLYLKHFPIREIKINKMFTTKLKYDKDTKQIVHTTIQLAHDIGARIVADGVSDKTTESILKELGCDYVQGPYISGPRTVEELLK